MPASLAELVAVKTKEQFRRQLLAALQGVGHTVHEVGGGLGNVYGQGAPRSAVTLKVKVTTSGALGGGGFAVSTDGGVTYTSEMLLPTAGFYVEPVTGVTLVFDVSNASSTSTPFVAGDVYAMALSVTTIPVTAWQPGSTALTLIENDADVDSDLSQLIQNVAAGGLLATSTNGWLDLLALNLYNLPRNLAKYTSGLITFSASAGVGPYTFVAGDRVVATAGGLQFVTTSGGTLTAGGTLQVSVRAVSAGALYNVGNGTIQKLLTPLAGVTVNNPDPGTGTWITSSGTDDEKDDALQQRCRARWQTLGAGATAASYDAWARAASSNVSRTVVFVDPGVPGQVDVILASASGPVSGGDVTAVQNYIQARMPLTSTVSVSSATGVIVPVTATVYVAAANLAAAQLQCPANLQALVAGTAIGGSLYLTNIIEQLSLPVGVRNVVVASPSGDVTLTSTQVAVLGTVSLTFVAV